MELAPWPVENILRKIIEVVIITFLWEYYISTSFCKILFYLRNCCIEAINIIVTVLVHTSDFAKLMVHKILLEFYTKLKFSATIKRCLFY